MLYSFFYFIIIIILCPAISASFSIYRSFAEKKGRAKPDIEWFQLLFQPLIDEPEKEEKSEHL